VPNFFAAARFSLRRCFSVFCGAFLASFFGLSALFKDSSFRSQTVRGMYYSCWRIPASASRRSSCSATLTKPVSLTPFGVRYHERLRARPDLAAAIETEGAHWQSIMRQGGRRRSLRPCGRAIIRNEDRGPSSAVWVAATARSPRYRSAARCAAATSGTSSTGDRSDGASANTRALQPVAGRARQLRRPNR
jgi:hypothetical protein